MRLAQLGYLILALSLSSYSLTASSEIYKHKDKNGRWQFTDKPVNKDGTPLKAKKSTSNSKTTSQQASRSDLKKRYSTVLIHQQKLTRRHFRLSPWKLKPVQVLVFPSPTMDS